MGTPKKSTVWPSIKDQAEDIRARVEALILRTPTSNVRNNLCDAQILINEAMRIADYLAKGGTP